MKNKILIIITVLFVALLLGKPIFDLRAVSIEELSREISKKRQEVERIEREMRAYEEKIQEQQKKAATLKRQLAILEADIEKTTLEIQKTEQEITKTELEIKKVELEIKKKEEEVARKKQHLAEYIQIIYEYGEESPLEIYLAYNNFSDFLKQYEYLIWVQKEAQEALDYVQFLKAELEKDKKSLEDLKKKQERLLREQEAQKESLEAQKGGKQQLLVETQEQEAVYQNLLEAARREQRQADAEIRKLEAAIRKQLIKEGRLPKIGKFIWPVEPKEGLSATFLDSSYQATFGIPHYAIDIPTPQGTRILAPAAGYVAKTKSAGKGYSYLVLIHGGKVSTVYGHIYRFAVKEGEYVAQGQVIAYSGGTPGTRGAGWLTTGPHLHFEVRIDGKPVDPLTFLP